MTKILLLYIYIFIDLERLDFSLSLCLPLSLSLSSTSSPPLIPQTLDLLVYIYDLHFKKLSINQRPCSLDVDNP